MIRSTKRRKSTFVYNKGDHQHIQKRLENNLKTRTIPPDVTHVIFNHDITELGCRSLEGLVNLVQVEFNDGLQTIGESAFEDCMSLRKVIGLPPTLHSIQQSAFLLCESLTKVRLPPVGLKIIGEGAFSKCSSLETMAIPASVERIEDSAFASCTSLTEVSFVDNYRLTHIGDRAFSCCSSLVTVNLPVTVKFIGKSAYELCGLKTVRLRFCESLMNLEEFTFAWCKQLTVVELPPTLQTIRRGAFKSCASLTEVDLPRSLQLIGSEAFYQSALRVLTIPSSVAVIGASACQHCYNLGELELQEGLKEIHNWAFADCRSLRAVFLPFSLAFVGDGAFRFCFNMLGVEVPLRNSQIKFGQYAFQRCESLYSIALDGDGHRFPESTFVGCSKLKITSEDENQDEDQDHRRSLMDASTLSPANKAVYFSRGITNQQLVSQLSVIHDNATQRTTPFHVLVASPELRPDVFEALFSKIESFSILSTKDIWGNIMMDYIRIVLDTGKTTPKIVSFVEMVIQKSIVDRIHQWGCPVQRVRIQSEINDIDWEDDAVSLWADILELFRLMGWYERRESLSVLELALWKAYRRADQNHEDERMLCGSAIAIPSVMPYLWKARSTPPPSIAFRCFRTT